MFRIRYITLLEASLSIVLFVSISSFFIKSDSLLSQTQTKKYRVGYSENPPPVKEKVEGIIYSPYSEIIHYIAEKEGWELEYFAEPWDEMLAEVITGDLDILMNMAYTKERAELVLFNKENIYNSWGEIIVSEDSNIRSITDLKNKKVATLNRGINTDGPQGILQQDKFFELNCSFQFYDNNYEILNAVQENIAEAGVLTRLGMNIMLSDFDLKRTGIVFSPLQVRFGINKKHPDAQYLADAFDKHLRELKSNPESVYYLAVDKYMGLPGNKSVIIPAWMRWSLYIGTGLTIVAFVLSGILRWQVNKRTTDLQEANFELKHNEKILRNIVEGTSAKTGSLFFQELTKNIASALDMKYALAVKLIKNPQIKCRTFVFWNDTDFGENFEYDLKGTPCEEVANGNLKYYENNIQKRFPEYEDIIHLGAVSYIGIPLTNSQGDVMGHLAVLDTKPLTNKNRKIQILEIFAARGESELERIITEQEYESLQEQLYQSQKMESIGRLAGGVAHDFNNILTGIMGYAEMLQLKFGHENSTEAEAASVILKSTERAANLTRQLLGFARKGKYNPVPLNMNSAIRETIRVSEKIFDKNINLYYELDEKLYSIEADKAQIEQVLTNLIFNAKDAMPRGGSLKITTENTIIDKAFASRYPELIPGDYILICITDTGVGISKNIIDSIFDPFFTTKSEGQGTGLGLATVYGIVKNHNGHITVYSEPEFGTTFKVYFPASKVAAIESNLEKELHAGAGKILLVDDEEFVRKMTSMMLQNLGYDVFVAENGKEALEIYNNHEKEIDVVLLDMVMPVMAGRETFFELKKINPSVNVVISSGYSQEGGATELMAKGAEKFLQKPYKMHELSQVFSEIINK